MSIPAEAQPRLKSAPPGAQLRSGKRRRWGVVAAAVIAAISIAVYIAVRPPIEKRWTPSNALTVTTPPSISDDADAPSLLTAIDQSLAWAALQDPERLLSFGPLGVPVHELIETLTDLKERVAVLGLTPPLFEYLRENYTFLSSTAPEVLFTGYFEARLRGSRVRTDIYRYPLYRRPDDLVVVDLSAWTWLNITGLNLPRTLRARITPERKVVPYFTRAEIDYSGALAGRGLEALWIDDPIDVFFLQIQGSGVVTLPDGSTQRVGYAEKNGHPYRPIGKLLIDRSILTSQTVSAQSIKAHLRSHPAEQQEIFSYNPSYVFFDLRERGPIGSLGTVVTGSRSIATDAALFPPGALAFMTTEKPVFDEAGAVAGWEKFGRFVLNQDTGGAITGPGRVDIFTGFGDAAESTAGVMKRTGSLFFLVKKKAAP